MNSIDQKIISEYKKARESEKKVIDSGGSVLDSIADDILYFYHDGVSDEFLKWQEEERNKMID